MLPDVMPTRNAGRGFSRQPAIMGVPITPASFAPDACPSQQGFTYERRHPAVATKILRHLGLPTQAVTTAEPCDIWRVRGPPGQLVRRLPSSRWDSGVFPSPY